MQLVSFEISSIDSLTALSVIYVARICRIIHYRGGKIKITSYSSIGKSVFLADSFSGQMMFLLVNIQYCHQHATGHETPV